MLIGLMGYAGVGKSTVARILCAEHGFVAPHIASPIKTMLGALLRSTGYDAQTVARFVDGDLKREIIPELGVTATEAQQTIGDWGRVCRPDLWLSLWLAKADAIIAAGGRVVQESVRFADEATAIKARGGILIEVRRPGFGPLSAHASEAVPSAGDIILDNCNCPTDLARQCACSIGNLCLQTPRFKGHFGTFAR
ncbi:hypothetical protein GCM10019059_07980 [Camelimonas fluminis]|uniref:Dephospho-CoA kinase n=1 Tax=Camelimonas fluminis TaxID=1576911 RepID=A0ABV7UE74_9HYPH|nr:hypothetical protein [Camelimonas fluminis]GHE51159.1 hypothetical protein GCM10019059_07980 [Camelimonas fluminis]